MAHSRSRKTPKSKSKRRPASGPQSTLDTLKTIRGLEGEIAVVLAKMEEKVRQVELLNRFSRLLNSSLEPEAVREQALEATCELLKCETGSLLIKDEKTNELFWDSALGDAGQTLKHGVRLPINMQSLAGTVASTGASLRINDVQSDPRHNKLAAKKSGFVTRTMLVVPLITKGKLIGVLQALNKIEGEFTVEDQELMETLAHQVAIAVENSNLYTELRSGFVSTVEVLTEVIEKRDRYTGGHSKRVAYYSVCIAKHYGLTREEQEEVRLSALLHDIGKVGVEDRILKKPAPLDEYEWPEMKKHPLLGAEIMKRAEHLSEVMKGMLYHHERWDGKGYPEELKGEEIPLVARIIAVADTYDAMVSTRPYRKGMDPKIAYDEISRGSGTQFDPGVVAAFQKAFEWEKMGRGTGFRAKKKQAAS